MSGSSTLAGWSEAAEETVAGLADALLADGVAGDAPARALFVPGRIELFGKHTDYAGGRSLLAATDRGVTLLATRRQDGWVRWRDVASGLRTGFPVAAPGRRPGHWSEYLRVVARRLAADCDPFGGGIDVAMASDLPPAAGLSSSSALVVACHLLLVGIVPPPHGSPLERLGASRERLAAYLGAVESGRGGGAEVGVGTLGGSEDHLAILASRPEHLRQYAFAPLRLEAEVALPSEWSLVVATSGVRAEKSGAARARFNRLAERAATAAAAWRRATGGDEESLGAALAAAGGDRRTLEEAVRRGLGGDAARSCVARARQFAVESGELVPAARRAVAVRDAEALGELAARSQRLAERDLRNQVAETTALVRLARTAGAFAASAFGAGFGGAVWALVGADGAGELERRWRRAYGETCPDAASRAVFWSMRPSDRARWLDIGEEGGAR